MHKKWLELRNNNPDEFGEKLCYCGHTFYCSCSDPDETLFYESITRGVLDPNDPKNGWKTLKE